MIRLLLILMFAGQMAQAQDFAALTRLDPTRSQIETGAATSELVLTLGQPVPHALFTLDGPPRLVIDFARIDWAGVEPADLGVADGLALGSSPDGASRLVLTLPAPQNVTRAAMNVDDLTGEAVLRVRLEAVSADAFAAAARTLDEAPVTAPTAPENGPLVVVLDPGHGGVDPGAVQGGVHEADLMLQLAREVAEALNRAGGVRAVLTREDDSFVSLEGRMSIAREAGADLLISLHADALEEDDARGASVYTLSAEASDAAAARMVERHQADDLVGGLDLRTQGDRVSTILLEMARRESAPASDRFAEALVLALREAGVRMNTRPRRSGRLAVLNAADFPSVLLEAGFLSSQADRAALTDPDGRARVAAGITAAVLSWALEEEMLAPLKRN